MDGVVQGADNRRRERGLGFGSTPEDGDPGVTGPHTQQGAARARVWRVGLSVGSGRPLELG